MSRTPESSRGHPENRNGSNDIRTITQQTRGKLGMVLSGVTTFGFDVLQGVSEGTLYGVGRIKQITKVSREAYGRGVNGQAL